jgi:hypothetical protein
MANPVKPDDLESKGKAGRRSTRVSLAIPIVLIGNDASGKPFRENTRTVVVNKQGAKLITHNRVVLGSEVSIENPAIGATAKVTVVWLGDRKNPKDPMEIGTQLLAPQNIWGIVFPPEDWEDGPPIGKGGIKLDRSTLKTPATLAQEVIPPQSPTPAQNVPAPVKSVSTPADSAVRPVAVSPAPPVNKLPAAPVKAAVPPAPTDHVPASKEKPPTVAELPTVQAAPEAQIKAVPVEPTKVAQAPTASPKTTPSRPTPPTAPVAATPLSEDRVNAAGEAALQKLTKELDDAVEARLKAYGEKVLRFTGQFGLRVQANLQDAANRTEDRMVGLMEQRLGGLADRVQSSRSALESLMTRLDHLHQNTESLLQNTEQEIREASQAALQLALQALTDSFSKEVETTAAALEAQSQKRIQDKGAEAAELVLKKTSEHLNALVDEELRKSASQLKSQQSYATLEAKEQLEQINLASQAIFQETIEAMAEAMAPSARNAMAASWAAAEAQFIERIQHKGAEIVKPLLEEADEHVTVLLEDCFRKSAAELKAQETQSVNDVKEQLDKLTNAAGAPFQEKLELMVREMAPSVRQEMEKSLETSAGALIDRTTRSLQEQTQLLSQDALLSLQQSVQTLQDGIQEESVRVRHTCQEETAGATLKIRQVCDLATAEATETLDRNITQRAEAGIGSLNLALEQGAAKLRATQLEAESALTPRIQNFHEQLASRSAFALESFQTDLQSNTRQLQEGAARQFSQKLQGVADEWTDIAADKVRRRIQAESAAVAETFSKESAQRLAALANEIYARSGQELKIRLNEQAKLQLDQMIKPAAAEFGETLRKTAREVALSLETDSRNELQKAANELLRASAESFHREGEQITGRVRSEIQASETALADRAQKLLETLSGSAVERLNHDALSWLEEFRARVRKSEQESQEVSLQKLEAGFQAAMEKQRATFSHLLEQQTDQARLQAALHIKSETEQVVSKATDALDKTLGRGSRVLAELGDQARAGLENQVQKIEMEAKTAVWNFQKQVDQSSSASIEQFRREMGTLVDEVVSRLHQSVRSFQGATSDELRSELQKASDNLLEVSSAQMRKQTEEALQLITEQLKRKEEEVASEAADIFRDRIAGIFALLQSSPRKASQRELVEPEKMKDPR